MTVRAGGWVGAPCQLAVSPATAYVTFDDRTQTAATEAGRTIRFYRPLNENRICASGRMPIGTNVFTDEVTFHRPAGLFGAFLKEAMARRGVKVKGEVRTANWLDRHGAPLDCGQLVELGRAESPPLRESPARCKSPRRIYTPICS